MLRYIGRGRRNWKRHPMPTHHRVNWEFLATLDGVGAPITGNESHSMQPPTLWLFAPEVPHGWTSDDPTGNEVAIFHFTGLNITIEQIARREGWLSTPLTDDDVNILRDMARELWGPYWRPTLIGELNADRALATLSLMIVRNRPECQSPIAPKSAVAAVESAERWILSHMTVGHPMAEAARAIGISPPQLHRFVHQVRGCSPRRLLLRLRFEVARRLMTESDLKLDSVARESGFSNASAFCRAFRAAHHCSPAHWRTEYHIRYHPPPAGKGDDPHTHRYSAETPAAELATSGIEL
jgi:AraC-like DNA-binding protein